MTIACKWRGKNEEEETEGGREGGAVTRLQG